MPAEPRFIRQVATRLIVFLLLVQAEMARAQYPRIGIIDFYGLRRVSESEVRGALKIVEGDAVPDAVTETEHRLATLPGILTARVSPICCTGGRTILFVGIEERGSPTLQFRSAPQGDVRLPDGMMQAGDDLGKAVYLAVLRGDAGEDDSKGHALMHDPVGRAIQERFMIYAARDVSQLREVLRHSAVEQHRDHRPIWCTFAGTRDSSSDETLHQVTQLPRMA